MPYILLDDGVIIRYALHGVKKEVFYDQPQ